ncbi:MAG: BMC domain-containing protein [Cyanobacteria bacterium]|nr:BMC domain-containing protein [Cyanobacteriota bacterium]MDA0867776.1 BMC domain-containing protein [Cyanobacteriota bacterium]
MALAIGVIETQGIPGALAIADALGKAAAVTVVRVENTEQGRVSVIIRGSTGAVQAAISQTQAHLSHHPGVALMGSHILPCPDGNVDAILPVQHSPNPSHNDLSWLDD